MMQAASEPRARWTPGPRLAGALAFAAERHGDQARKGSSDPYATHLLAVSAMVIEHGGTEDQAIAALLHDVVEDTGATYEELAGFGPTVVAIVRACTDATSQEKASRSLTWRQRKERYIAHLRATPPGDPYPLVALADKTHNAETSARELEGGLARDLFFARFNSDPESQRWYFGSLIAAFRSLALDEGARRLLARLERAVATMFPDGLAGSEEEEQ